jgi:hypothetical protein
VSVVKTTPSRGSHLPVLMKLLAETTGPVLEMGCRMYSTPYLHWACFATQRPLVTIEGSPEWWAWAKQYESPWHQVICAENWDQVDLSRAWSIAFVDHSPNERRWQDILRLTHAEYVVAHDAENSQGGKYQYARVHGAFRYRTKYTQAPGPFTAIFSNVHDVRGLVI